MISKSMMSAFMGKYCAIRPGLRDDAGKMRQQHLGLFLRDAPPGGDGGLRSLNIRGMVDETTEPEVGRIFDQFLRLAEIVIKQAVGRRRGKRCRRKFRMELEIPEEVSRRAPEE